MSAGKELVERIVADMAAAGLEPDTREREILVLAERMADLIDKLERSIARRGVATQLESGRVVANPSVAQLTQASAALAKLLDKIQMTTEAPVNLTKQRAAKARWRDNEAKAR